jgi:hypothetical protein
VHTRRIGAAPDLHNAPVTDITGGGKFTHYGQRVDIGTFAVFEDDTGQSDGRDCFTTRVQSRVNGLVLGHSLTYVDRPTLGREAMVNAIDGDWQGGGGLRIRGQLLYSGIDQDENEVDGRLEQDDSDIGAWTRWSYRPDDANDLELNLLYYGGEFEMNDMGFLRRNDWWFQSAQYKRIHNSYPEPSALQQSFWRVKPNRAENVDDGDQLYASVDLLGWWKWRSTQEFTAAVHVEGAHRRDDLITRGNGTAKLDLLHSLMAHYLSPRGSNFNYGFRYVAETRGTDKWAHQFDFEPTFYASERLTLSAELSYTWFDEWLLWDFRSHQLATYETDLIDANLTFEWYPRSRHEVRMKLHWAAVKSDALQGYDLAPNCGLINSTTPVDDFSTSDIAAQIRYRYRIAPLSDFYLVYTRGGFWGEDENREGMIDLLNNSWNNVSSEGVLAKVSYRF